MGALLERWPMLMEPVSVRFLLQFKGPGKSGYPWTVDEV